MTTPKSPPTYNFTNDSSLASWNRTGKECLIRKGPDKDWDGLATACIVFNPSDQILVIQRASHDSLPNRWELPGGAVDDEDATVLHGAARELWEESGLVARHFTHLVTQGPGGAEEETFSNRARTKKFARFSFAVEVESCEVVKLDPNEHQRFGWVSEEDVKAMRVGDGGLKLEITKEGVTNVILEAFRLRKKRGQAL